MGKECSAHGREDYLIEHNILAGKPEGRRPLGRPRRRLVDNIKMALRYRVLGDMD
jgi:hypothetical protein